MKCIAKGNTAEIYEYGDNLILKLFYPQYPTDYVKHELYNAVLAEKLGIKTPKAHGLIIKEGRQGIIYDRIEGEPLSTHTSGIGEPLFSVWMKKFVDFHKQLMQLHTEDAISYKDFLKKFATVEETIIRIEALPDGNCFLHGDFHPANVMVDKDNNLVCVDMMNVCRGTPLYDIARTYFLLNNDNNVRSRYLKYTGYTLEDIMPYLDVIVAIRDNEVMKLN